LRCHDLLLEFRPVDELRALSVGYGWREQREGHNCEKSEAFHDIHLSTSFG
jgi:hypothetical protein